MFPSHHEKFDQLCRRGVRSKPNRNAWTEFIARNAFGDRVDRNASYLELVRPSLHVQLDDGRRPIPNCIN